MITSISFFFQTVFSTFLPYQQSDAKILPIPYLSNFLYIVIVVPLPSLHNLPSFQDDLWQMKSSFCG